MYVQQVVQMDQFVYMLYLRPDLEYCITVCHASLSCINMKHVHVVQLSKVQGEVCLHKIDSVCSVVIAACAAVVYTGCVL